MLSLDSTTTLTYDALGREVEQNQSGTYFQIVYSPMGAKLGMFKGQTMQQVYVPLPGGDAAEYLSWGLSHYRHADWQGSDRLEANTSRSVIDNNAYAPFGEPYAQTGNGEISYTGQNKDTAWLQYDFLARQYDPKQGRWISPDPAGMAAADPANPQSWNRYAYVLNNPLALVDPLGLLGCPGLISGGGGCAGDPSVSGNDPMFGQPNLAVTRGAGFGIDGPQMSAGFGMLGMVGNGLDQILPGENSTSYSLGPSPLQILQNLLSGNFSDLGVPTLGQLTNSPCDFGVCAPLGNGAFNSEDYCGIGYHCDATDIAESCAVDATIAGLGLDSLTDFTWSQIKDQLGKLVTGAGAKAIYGKLLGKVGGRTIFKVAGGVVTGYAIYDFAHTASKTFGECTHKNMPTGKFF